MPRSKEITLDRLLDTLHSGAGVPTDLHPGDQAFLRQQYAEAASAYEAVTDESEETRAKRGFCLAMIGKDSDAETLLTPGNVGRHPVARAILAWAIAGWNGSRLSSFGSNESADKQKWREEQVRSLLGPLLLESKPPRVAFSAAFEIGYRANFESLPLAERACDLYPDWETPHHIRARGRRLSGSVENAELDSLLRFLATSDSEELFHESYVFAMLLARYSDADDVVDRLEAIVLSDEQKGDGNRAAIDEMRAMVDLHRAREGEPTCYEKVRSRMSIWAADNSPRQIDGHEPTAAPSFLLQVALETNDGNAINKSATLLVDRLWPSRYPSHHGPDGWAPLISSPSLRGVLQVDLFGFDFTSRWREVEGYLLGAAAKRWRLLVAAYAIEHGEPDDEQLQAIRSADYLNAPWWIAQPAYNAFVEFEPFDFAGAGALLATLAHRLTTVPQQDVGYYESDLEMLSIDSQGSDDVIQIFEGALAWLIANTESTGRELLKVWGQVILDNDGQELLAKIATLSLERTESKVARDYLDQVNERADPAFAVRRMLEKFPDPDSSRAEVEELTLLEAAAVVALLRASPLDHIQWTLAPIAQSGRLFDPNRKFITVLWELMKKGVITAHPSTPISNLYVKDGSLWATLDQVVWRISPHTLELHRAIRDMPHSMWPAQWRSHAPVLARDLGVEEMVAYISYLLEERDLPIPDQDELRAIFRIQLDKLSMSQCYYLSYKTVLSVLDYKTKYRPGGKQLEGRALNVLRDNGERAVEGGWDTRYRRIKALPASLLFESLHDVLTGWGERAFDEPIVTLSIGTPDASSTRH